MKKFISLTLVAVMVLSMSLFMASCGGDDKEAGGDAGKADKGLKVTGVISTKLGDKSFNDSAKAGLDTLSEQGFDTNIVECNNDKTQFEQGLRNAAEDSDMVVAVGSELNMIESVAKDYPKVKFVWVDNVSDNLSKYDNLTCISYKQNEGSYLVGYVAGKMTKSDVIGFVGGNDIAVINDFYVGYKQGAKAANPKVKVVKNYTNDWTDTNLGAECGQALAAQGADSIFCAAGGAGNGVIIKAKELGIKAIGVDKDQRVEMPDYADDILCSMVKEVGNSIINLVKNYAEDESTWPGAEVFYAGMDGNYISVAYGGKDQKVLVPEDIMKEVEKQSKKIQDGTIKVDTVLKQ